MRGPFAVDVAATTSVIACRRYRCIACGAVMTVVPLGIEPRRYYGRAAICLALGLWVLAGEPVSEVRRRACAWVNPLATTWRAPSRWAATIASGAWTWCRAAAGLDRRDAAARAVQIAAGRAPPEMRGAVWELAYAGGAALG